LGEILIEEGICTLEQVIDAIGVTDGAVDSAFFFVLRGKITEKEMKATVQEWKAQTKRESLFDILVNKGCLNKEDLYESSFVSCAGRCTTCGAGPCRRAEDRPSPGADAISGGRIPVGGLA
jgi:hypothetical protein